VGLNKTGSPLFEIASVFVCFDDVASRIVNTNHRIGSSGEGKNSAAFQRR